MTVATGLPERFWQRVNKTETCWWWTGRAFPNGYGIIDRGDGPVIAHRWAYEVLVGPIPEHHELHHTCRNPPCVNPAHLQPLMPGAHRDLHATRRPRRGPTPRTAYRLNPALRGAMRDRARAEGVTETAWLEEAISERLSRQCRDDAVGCTVQENETLALGGMTAALLAYEPAEIELRLAEKPGEWPRLFVRFPYLKSQYEITMTLVPDTERDPDG